MKAEIHPKYQATSFACACGNKVEIRSTTKDVHVEICSACHPFYTGKQKLVDSAGRIEKFTRKYQKINAAKKAKVAPAEEAKVAAPVEEAVAQEAPAEEAVAQEAPAEEAVAQEAPAEDPAPN